MGHATPSPFGELGLFLSCRSYLRLAQAVGHRSSAGPKIRNGRQGVSCKPAEFERSIRPKRDDFLRPRCHKQRIRGRSAAAHSSRNWHVCLLRADHVRSAVGVKSGPLPHRAEWTSLTPRGPFTFLALRAHSGGQGETRFERRRPFHHCCWRCAEQSRTPPRASSLRQR
jgi:hypothetical protein